MNSEKHEGIKDSPYHVVLEGILQLVSFQEQ